MINGYFILTIVIFKKKSSTPINPPFFNQSSKPEAKKPSANYRIILPLAVIDNTKFHDEKDT